MICFSVTSMRGGKTNKNSTALLIVSTTGSLINADVLTWLVQWVLINGVINNAESCICMALGNAVILLGCPRRHCDVADYT